MSFVVYDKNSKRIIGVQHDTQAGAKISMAARKKKEARLAARYPGRDVLDLDVTTLADYNANIRTTKVVKNLLSGQDVTIDVNTPLCCDPSSETYWSM